MPKIKFGDEIPDGEYDESGRKYKDNGTMPLLDGYTLEELIYLYGYGYGKATPEESEEIFRCYMDYVTLPFWNLLNLRNIGASAKGSKISNHGKIDFYGNPLIPVQGKIKILGIEFCVYRLVAEVFRSSPDLDPDIYDTVHHIGYDYVNNSKNLLFVTKYQHDAIRNIITGEILPPWQI